GRLVAPAASQERHAARGEQEERAHQEGELEPAGRRGGDRVAFAEQRRGALGRERREDGQAESRAQLRARVQQACRSPGPVLADPGVGRGRRANEYAAQAEWEISRPGRMSDTYEPSTGIRDSQYSPPAAITAPTTITGFVPTRANS